MLHLYLDESGDLGFTNKNSSKFFTITILVIKNDQDNRTLINAAKRTIRKKLNPKNQNKIHELKGTTTAIEAKKYFYEQISCLELEIYSITLNKKLIPKNLTKNKEKIYNFITEKIIKKISFEKSEIAEFIIDKSKGKKEIAEFDFIVKEQLKQKIKLLHIQHQHSCNNYGIQACDLFSYGIFTEYESNKKEWRKVFEEKILLDEMISAL